ncbi:MAG: dienelactone hydrolase family protein [Cyclobacteriaceae bacterium]|nr:dienelactone hydrolase family protein [Cyclobacteriaceae bacterium]UYN86769.1 MAG: dienelactone hydrolase family protein [Cyclobacteriaceae bacterium]
MKKINLLFMLCFIAVTTWAQDGITICHTPATEKFALFASNKDFNRAHADPLPYTHQSSVGKMITFKTPDGKDANGYLLTAKTKTNSWIFVFQEWWGLNDHIKREAEQLYNDLGNVNVLAIDMYDGKVTDKREEAGQLMGAFKQERGNGIVQGAVNYAGKDAKIGTVGWCFGGGQSLQAALTAGKQAVAAVMYYGMPEENIDRLKTLNCDVLNIWPTQDQWINKAVMDKFEANMKAAGKNLTVKAYDADHAFANPSNPKHNKEFTADAHKHTLEFFKARLK